VHIGGDVRRLSDVMSVFIMVSALLVHNISITVNIQQETNTTNTYYTTRITELASNLEYLVTIL